VEAGKKVRSKTKLKSRFNCYGGFGFLINYVLYTTLSKPQSMMNWACQIKTIKHLLILTDENRTMTVFVGTTNFVYYVLLATLLRSLKEFVCKEGIQNC
jgi:hypothetical protein